MFPDVQNVFEDKIVDHEKFLFPLFSIDLKQIINSWNGLLHFVEFNEDPYNVETAGTFNEYCKDRMIAFDIINNRYSFKADFKYFDLSPDWVESFEKQSILQKLQFVNRFGGEPEWMQSDGSVYRLKPVLRDTVQ